MGTHSANKAQSVVHRIFDLIEKHPILDRFSNEEKRIKLVIDSSYLKLLMLRIFLIISLLHVCYAGDEKCTASGGICQNRYSCNLGYSKIETGKCAGNIDRICRVPKCVEAGGE